MFSMNHPTANFDRKLPSRKADGKTDSSGDISANVTSPGNGDASEPSYIAVLPAGERIWAVPSIHGEASQLKALHRVIGENFKPGRDRIIYLGNYLGYGAAIAGTMDEILRFRRQLLMLPGTEAEDLVYLRGAQEEMWSKLLKLQMASDPLSALQWMMTHGVQATLEAYGGSSAEGERKCREGTMAITKWAGALRKNMQANPGHFELMTSLSRAAHTSDRGILFVHASIDPSRPLSMQGDIFWWDNETFERINRPYQAFKKVVRGYDHKRRGPTLDRDFRVTLDSGCGFGGPLVGAALDPAGAVLQVIEAAP